MTTRFCDSGARCDVATVYISVTAVNRPPVAVNDSFVLPEASNMISLAVLENDSDPDFNLDASSVSLVTSGGGPLYGVVTVDPVHVGRLVYTVIDGDFTGEDSFMYQVCDTGSPVYCAQSWVNVTIAPVNDDGPIAVDDATSTFEVTPVVIDVLRNDSADSMSVPSGEAGPNALVAVSVSIVEDLRMAALSALFQYVMEMDV